MRTMFRCTRRSLTAALVLLAVAVCGAAPVNPQVFKTMYDEKSKNAEIVAKVQVVYVTCSAATGEADNRSVTLQLGLKILEVEKGALKKDEVIVVSHKVTLPAGPGPRSYGYMAAQRQFPFTPAVQGHVALNLDKEKNMYVVVVGWVPEPNGAAIPTEVGKKIAVEDKPK